MQRGNIGAFIEMKARTTVLVAKFTLEDWRLRRVTAAAEALAPRSARQGEDLRNDVIVIIPWRLPRHVQNVWFG